MAEATWTDERVELLKKLWADGLSASQVAARMGGGLTRNAVLSKVHRSGLARRSETVVRKAYVRTKPMPPKPEPKPRPVVIKPRPALVAEPLPPEPPAVARITNILDLDACHCRWPIGDPRHAGFGYCGDEAVLGKPYCRGHMARAMQPPSLRRRGEAETVKVSRVNKEFA